MDLSFLVDGRVLVHGMDTSTWWVTVASVSSVGDVNSEDSWNCVCALRSTRAAMLGF